MQRNLETSPLSLSRCRLATFFGISTGLRNGGSVKARYRPSSALPHWLDISSVTEEDVDSNACRVNLEGSKRYMTWNSLQAGTERIFKESSMDDN